MNKVWVLTYCHYDWFEFMDFWGVFYSKEKAEEFIHNNHEKVCYPIIYDELEHEKLGDMEESHFYIFEEEVK